MGKTFAEAMLEKGLVTEQQVKQAERQKHAGQMRNKYEDYVPPPNERFHSEKRQPKSLYEKELTQ